MVAKGKLKLNSGICVDVSFDTATLTLQIGKKGDKWPECAKHFTTGEINQLLDILSRARGIGRKTVERIAEMAGFLPGFWNPSRSD